MTEHEIIVSMAKAMAQADGVPVESMPPSMTWGGVDYLGTARRQYHGFLVVYLAMEKQVAEAKREKGKGK